MIIDYLWIIYNFEFKIIFLSWFFIAIYMFKKPIIENNRRIWPLFVTISAIIIQICFFNFQMIQIINAINLI